MRYPTSPSRGKNTSSPFDLSMAAAAAGGTCHRNNNEMSTQSSIRVCEKAGQVSSEDHLAQGELKKISPPQPRPRQQQQQQQKQRKVQDTLLNTSRWHVDMEKDQNPCSSPSTLLQRIFQHSKRNKRAVVAQRREVEEFLSRNRWSSEEDGDDDESLQDFDSISTKQPDEPYGTTTPSSSSFLMTDPTEEEDDSRMLTILHPDISPIHHSDHHHPKQHRHSFDGIPTPPRRKKSIPTILV
ncbi:hypothetical protein IV203_014135 [Nitzschia inconspicua]|uniref:Uncharacterized protein n=1 Tax=Nitzschia inconspicua TaxID=303405 RepID=A0A9K3Q9A1_9STRA|nr:hypothetical protein IV203_014135 [Nitzschia inconspicua]